MAGQHTSKPRGRRRVRMSMDRIDTTTAYADLPFGGELTDVVRDDALAFARAHGARNVEVYESDGTRRPLRFVTRLVVETKEG